MYEEANDSIIINHVVIVLFNALAKGDGLGPLPFLQPKWVV